MKSLNLSHERLCLGHFFGTGFPEFVRQVGGVFLDLFDKLLAPKFFAEGSLKHGGGADTLRLHLLV